MQFGLKQASADGGETEDGQKPARVARGKAKAKAKGRPKGKAKAAAKKKPEPKQEARVGSKRPKPPWMKPVMDHIKPRLLQSANVARARRRTRYQRAMPRRRMERVGLRLSR